MGERLHPRHSLRLSVPLPRVPSPLALLPHPLASSPQCCSVCHLLAAGTVQLPASPARLVPYPRVPSSAGGPWHPPAGAVRPPRAIPAPCLPLTPPPARARVAWPERAAQTGLRPTAHGRPHIRRNSEVIWHSTYLLWPLSHRLNASTTETMARTAADAIAQIVSGSIDCSLKQRRDAFPTASGRSCLCRHSWGNATPRPRARRRWPQYHTSPCARGTPCARTTWPGRVARTGLRPTAHGRPHHAWA